MVAASFPQALRLVLVDEGGLDDDPHDHGGRTAHGIIQREYDGFRARHGQPRQDVWKITPAEYTEIYHDRYWIPWCDRLPAGVDYAFFDSCVNAGPVQAAKTLQKALRVRVDGHMGDVTLATAMADDPSELIKDFCEARRQFYRALAQFPRYGRGWLNRVNHVEKAALAMVVDPAQATRNGFDDDMKSMASARAKAEDVKTPVLSTETAGATAIATGGGASLTDTLSSATSQLSPFQDSIHLVKYILVIVAVLSVGLTVYAVWHKQRIAKAT